RIVAERLADLRQDAALSWQDPAHLRTLGRTAVGELRYQGERKGWDARRTDTVVRNGLNDLYAGAVEAALGQDPERAATLYAHARDVIQPEQQAAVERKIERAREERRVTEILGGLADTPDDPTRRPDLDDYQARAAELTPPDASPEVRAQVSRLARIEQARADRAWQAARGRAATSALDWLGENPAAPLMAMPAELRDGLSAEQMDRLEAAATNSGRVVTDRDLYDRLDDQAVRNPEDFAGLDLTQHRLSLGDSDYNRLTKVQKALAEGKSDPTFERHRLGRLFLGEGLRTANLDPDGEEARTARQQLDRLLGAFETVEGKPPTMADIRGLVGDVLPRVNGDPNIVRVGGGEPVKANGNTQIAPPQETLGADDDVQIAQQQEAQNRPPAKQPTPPQSAAPSQEPGRGYGKKPQAEIEKGMTPLQIRINRDQAFRELTRQPLTPEQEAKGAPLPDDWETTKPADIVDAIKRAAERHGVPTQMFARLLYQEGKFNERDKLREPLVMDSTSRFKAIGYAQMNKNTLQDLLQRARARGDVARAEELETYSLGNFRQAFDAAAENLALNYKLTGGSWPQAVAAYNVGAGDLVSWLKGARKIPLIFR
ncbi:MAG: hypothetical protein JWQ58_624, partial [Reyranella sp.]|nr:hypothetical protein [Reyranella sp.]